jgi:CPA2 family monovalent cation:H+ antiporter-2
MLGGDFFQSLVSVLLTAVVIVSLAPRLKISPVVGYVIAGALLGPEVSTLIREPEELEVLAHLGVVFLLFHIGLELSLERLKQLRFLVFGLGTTQVLVTGAILAVVARLSGETWMSAAVLGGALAFSSTAFAMQLLQERSEAGLHFGLVAFAILLLQDLAVLPMLALVTALGRAQENLLLVLASDLARAVGAVVVTVLVGRYLLRPMFRQVALSGHRELFVPAALLVVLGAAWGMTLVGLSMALGALLAGLMLSETEWRHQVEADLRPFKGLFLGFFFMYVGMTADLSILKDYWYVVLALAGGLMLGKGALLFFLCRAFRKPPDVALSVAAYLSQGGEFAFLLLSTAVAGGVVPAGVAALAMAAIVVTLVLTPVAVSLGRRAAERWHVTTMLPETLTAAGEAISGHLLIAGYGRVGQTVAQLAAARGLPHLALDLDPVRVTRARQSGEAVFFGDASRTEVLESAGLERARAVVVALDDRDATDHLVKALRERHRDLPVFARAHDLEHAQSLQKHGATYAVPETVEGSLLLGAAILEGLGQDTAEVDALIDSIRARGYAGLSASRNGRS